MQQEKTHEKIHQACPSLRGAGLRRRRQAHAENTSGERMRDGMTMRLNKAMKNTDGTISFDQVSIAMEKRLKQLAAYNGGKLSVADLADALENA